MTRFLERFKFRKSRSVIFSWFIVVLLFLNFHFWAVEVSEGWPQPKPKIAWRNTNVDNTWVHFIIIIYNGSDP